MKTEHIETMDELVFKNRNKLYGAYLLRRKYQKNLVLSLLSGLFVILSVVSYPLIAAFLNPDHGIHIGPEYVIAGPMPPPADVAPPPPPPPPPAPVAPDRIRFVAPMVVDKDVDDNMIPQGEMDNQPSQAPPPEMTDIPPVDNAKNTIEQPVPPQEPFILVEQMPEFPGGETELFSFLSQNLRYPPEARQINVSGVVFVYFVVEPDGLVSGIRVRRGIGSGCDEEAMRIVGLMPRWSPGKQGGVPVRVQFTLPVKFTLL